MRFRRTPRPERYRETSRNRAAFLRRQRLEREALPLFAETIAADQHGDEEEMVVVLSDHGARSARLGSGWRGWVDLRRSALGRRTC